MEVFRAFGPIPGRYEDLFRAALNPNTSLLVGVGVGNGPNTSVEFNLRNCSQQRSCQDFMTSSVRFVKVVTLIFRRPFPSLGTMVTILADNVFVDNGFDFDMTGVEKICHDFLAAMFKEFYPDENVTVSLHDLYAWGSNLMSMYNKPKYTLSHTNCSSAQYSNTFWAYHDYIEESNEPFPCYNSDKPCCNILTENIIGRHLERFSTMMKLSQVQNNVLLQDNARFLSEFVNNSSLLKHRNLTLVSRPTNNYGQILFCDMVQDLSDIHKRLPGCSKFYPVSTSYGVCQSFNSLPAHEIYEPLPYLQNWNKVFGINQFNYSLTYPKGFGSSKGMFIILNSFESVKSPRTTNDFVLSISNENNNYDIVRHNFQVQPGNFYTFRIMASQTTTTTKFEAMNLKYRNCRLDVEKGGLKYMKSYTKSGCEYECALNRSALKCHCIPWNLPRSPSDHRAYCDMLGNMCFSSAMKASATFDDCDCPDDCTSTALSIFESSRPLTDLTDYCDPSNSLFYDFKVFTVEKLYYGFYYDYVVNNGPNPDSYDEICRYLLQRHVAIVKVEMATKSIIRSKRDKKFSFETQLSSLGIHFT